MLAVIVFGAYVLGILLSDLTFGRFVSRSRRISEQSEIDLTNQGRALVAQATHEKVDHAELEAVLQPSGFGPREESLGDYSSRDRVEILQHAFVGGVVQDIPHIAMRLHLRSRDLYDEYDRAVSEAEFRGAIALPIAGVLAALGWSFGYLAWWVMPIFCLAGIAVMIWLEYRSRQKQLEANETVLQAYLIGDVASPTADNVKALIARVVQSREEASEASARKRASAKQVRDELRDTLTARVIKS